MFGLVSETDDVAIVSAALHVLFVDVGKFGSCIVGGSVFHETAVHLNLVGGFRYRGGTVFQRLDKASTGPHGGRVGDFYGVAVGLALSLHLHILVAI